MTAKWHIKRETVEEYLKFTEKETLPYWLSVPGFKEIRAYRDRMSGKVLLMMEFDSYESWGKAMDAPKSKEIMEKFRSLTYESSWTIWDQSPVIPEPLIPK